MRFNVRGMACLAAGLILLAGPAASDADPTTKGFSGGFSIGVRSVDFSGAEHKFKEDFNLDDGPRLFNLQFNLVPEGKERSFADQLTLSVQNLGGDPFENIHLGVRKYGRYNLSYNRYKSDYFYADLLGTSGSAVPIPDFHTFDFERVRDKAKLDLHFNQQATFTFAMDRMVKSGESTTTLDLQRDEFEFDRPIHESLNSYSGAFEYAWDKVTLVVEERVRDYENAYEIFLPGQSLGEDAEDAAVLDFYFLDQPYDLSSNEHIVRLRARPNDRLRVRLNGMVQSSDLDFFAQERGQGTTFTGQPFSLDNAGNGDINRDADHFEAELDYLVNQRVAITAGVRRQTLDQDGDFPWVGNVHTSDWAIDTTGITVGAEFFVSPALTLHGGLIGESRDAEFSFAIVEPDDVEGHGEDTTTDRTGVFAGAAWRPSDALELTVDLEDNSFDDPFTLATPTDRSRYRVTGKYRWQNGFNLKAIYSLRDYDNKDSGFASQIDTTVLRLGYTHADLSFSVGYSAVDSERAIDQLVSTGTLFNIRYLSDADFTDARARWRANDRVTVGGEVRLYENAGSFGLERDDFRAYLEVGVFEDYVLQLGYRTVDYDETEFDFDDYDADMIDIGIGYSW